MFEALQCAREIFVVAAVRTSYKIVDNISMFLRVPFTRLDRWFAFFTKFPRDYRFSQTNYIAPEGVGFGAQYSG